MTNSVSSIEALPGPTGSVPFNESVYASNAAFLSWGGRAKGGWIVRGTINLDNAADGNDAAENISVPGVEVGDYCEAVLSIGLQSLQLSAYAANGAVVILVQNVTGGAVNLGVGTFLVRVTDLT